MLPDMMQYEAPNITYDIFLPRKKSVQSESKQACGPNLQSVGNLETEGSSLTIQRGNKQMNPQYGTLTRQVAGTLQEINVMGVEEAEMGQEIQKKISKKNSTAQIPKNTS